MRVPPLPVVESLAVASEIWPGFDAVLSVEDASRDPEDHRAFAFPVGHALAVAGRLPAHLRLAFDDVDRPYDGYVAPTRGQIERALEFARRHGAGRLLVHCHAGQCRSAGLALGMIAERLGAGLEKAAVAHLLRIRPIAAPNLMVLDLVDGLLGRGGRLKAAWMAHEDADEKLLRLRFLRECHYTEASPGKTP